MNKVLKIALIGYGKMGKEIEEAVYKRGHSVGAIIETDTPQKVGLLSGCDVAIEFTQPDAAVQNIQLCLDAKLPIVVGTTGWYQHYEEITQKVKHSDGAILTATNFSIGVNLFFRINELVAGIMQNQNQYNVSIEEIHHIHKKDAPSGTAITTAERVIAFHNRYENWNLTDSNESTGDRELPITAIRQDNVPGTHTVSYVSAVDSIEVKHTAFNRKGFAEGSVVAAEWLAGRKGVFTMKDVLGF